MGLIVAFRPINSEAHSTPALLPGSHRLLPGSLKIALKPTRPRQRFFILLLAGILCQREDRVKRGIPTSHDVMAINTSRPTNRKDHREHRILFFFPSVPYELRGSNIWTYETSEFCATFTATFEST